MDLWVILRPVILGVCNGESQGMKDYPIIDIPFDDSSHWITKFIRIRSFY